MYLCRVLVYLPDSPLLHETLLAPCLHHRLPLTVPSADDMHFTVPSQPPLLSNVADCRIASRSVGLSGASSLTHTLYKHGRLPWHRVLLDTSHSHWAVYFRRRQGGQASTPTETHTRTPSFVLRHSPVVHSTVQDWHADPRAAQCVQCLVALCLVTCSLVV